MTVENRQFCSQLTHFQTIHAKQLQKTHISISVMLLLIQPGKTLEIIAQILFVNQVYACLSMNIHQSSATMLSRQLTGVIIRK